VLMLIRRGDRVHLEATGIERPAEAADDAALAGRIPSLEHEKRTFRGAEIGLLDELQRLLQRRQAPLVVGKIHLRMGLDRRQPRAAPHDKKPGLQVCRAHQARLGATRIDGSHRFGEVAPLRRQLKDRSHSVLVPPACGEQKSRLIAPGKQKGLTTTGCYPVESRACPGPARGTIGGAGPPSQGAPAAQDAL
jgi:hypothetical protein